MKATFHVRVYVGPTLVNTLAAEFRKAGLHVQCEGTAHIHCHVTVASGNSFDAPLSFLQTLRTRLGKTFCLEPRDVAVVRLVSVN